MHVKCNKCNEIQFLNDYEYRSGKGKCKCCGSRAIEPCEKPKKQQKTARVAT